VRYAVLGDREELGAAMAGDSECCWQHENAAVTQEKDEPGKTKKKQGRKDAMAVHRIGEERVKPGGGQEQSPTLATTHPLLQAI
jgi:hypothetical protein